VASILGVHLDSHDGTTRHILYCNCNGYGPGLDGLNPLTIIILINLDYKNLR